MLDPTIPIILAGIVLAFALTMRLSRPFAQTPPDGEAPFVPKPVLNGAERRLHATIERLLPPGHRLLCQVSYGEMMTCRTFAKFNRINQKRADMVICDAAFRTVAVIELHGAGHRGQRAARSDAVRRTACAEAGLALVEVPTRHDAASVAALLAPVLRRGMVEPRGL